MKIFSMTRVKISHGKQCVRFYKFKFCNLSEKFKLAKIIHLMKIENNRVDVNTQITLHTH